MAEVDAGWGTLESDNYILALGSPSGRRCLSVAPPTCHSWRLGAGGWGLGPLSTGLCTVCSARPSHRAPPFTFCPHSPPTRAWGLRLWGGQGSSSGVFRAGKLLLPPDQAPSSLSLSQVVFQDLWSWTPWGPPSVSGCLVRPFTGSELIGCHWERRCPLKLNG